MGQPAARITDMHVCPLVTPPGVPHVGGPISAPSAPTVLIGKLPAAGPGSVTVCVGPPDAVAGCSPKTLLSKMPASRMGDSCAHGGTIVLGCFTVLIG